MEVKAVIRELKHRTEKKKNATIPAERMDTLVDGFWEGSNREWSHQSASLGFTGISFVCMEYD
jgi:hypothetical protein